ncbi:TRAP dicarboxylate transporter- DctP subunit [Magnetococcus marinus MC-1]|uniref:TRAP dicarboxylate transporter-DctP subunit n=1 Tax=Magnetococcus marinus (strain ATCC BAA-1437 / JCM 17883 / MC-1) TaxID=156889 RepID=A0L513_MAGMM|nr:TRAP transporter substrate-binding protein DctP [Magnetococcus marinus]ABK43056.1 TRAP dicarboxylate transporter- DctP subunit [Magnetococcus marinus MC-1]
MQQKSTDKPAPLPRRQFIKGTLAATATAAVAAPAIVSSKARTRWQMVTAWPRNFPGLGTGANALANLITEMSGGRLEVQVFGAGELVGAFEIFDVVSRGTADMGHGASYYWKGKHPATQFFSAVPFGLTAQEMNAWIYQGGGYELWQKLYAQFDLIPGAAGNTGTQMGGWFNKEIHKVEDLQGLKMRMPGLGGEVLKRAGGTPVNIPGGEIFAALQAGTIDATEWVGPYNDLAFGLYKAAKYYYYPGWHEPGTTLECFVSRKSFEKLPKDLQSIVLNAIRVANLNMLSDFTARNNAALEILVNKHKVSLRRYPDEVLAKLKTLSDEVVAEIALEDPLSKEVYDSFRRFRDQAVAWNRVSEQAYVNARQV